MSKKVISNIILLAVVAAIAYGAYVIVTSPKIAEGEIVARNGVHWHANLLITVNGEKIAIPASVGIKAGETHPSRMHTHEADNTIHAEKPGIVTADDLRLKNFFEVWEKDFSKDSILGNKAENGKTIKFIVNGVENTEYENYAIKDHDVLEIIYQ